MYILLLEYDIGANTGDGFLAHPVVHYPDPENVIGTNRTEDFYHM